MFNYKENLLKLGPSSKKAAEVGIMAPNRSFENSREGPGRRELTSKMQSLKA